MAKEGCLLSGLMRKKGIKLQEDFIKGEVVRRRTRARRVMRRSITDKRRLVLEIMGLMLYSGSRRRCYEKDEVCREEDN